jgi:hypothetical protein
MIRDVAVLASALAFCAGCLNGTPGDGVLCGTQRQCPDRFYCAADDRCYHEGVLPDLAANQNVDLLCVAASGCGNCAPPDGSGTAMVLPFTWQGEEETYWDAAAATRIALSTRTSTLPGQAELASYLNTTPAGILGVSVVLGALNHYLSTNWFQLKYISDPPTVPEYNKLKQDVLINIPSGYPMVANVISGWRPGPVCYPGGDINHYITIVGYDHGGDEVLVADPGAEGAGGSGWSTVTQTYWISLQDLAVWIGGAAYTA